MATYVSETNCPLEYVSRTLFEILKYMIISNNKKKKKKSDNRTGSPIYVKIIFNVYIVVVA